MTAVYLYGTMISREDKMVFWIIATRELSGTVLRDLEHLTGNST